MSRYWFKRIMIFFIPISREGLAFYITSVVIGILLAAAMVWIPDQNDAVFFAKGFVVTAVALLMAWKAFKKTKWR